MRPISSLSPAGESVGERAFLFAVLLSSCAALQPIPLPKEAEVHRARTTDGWEIGTPRLRSRGSRFLGEKGHLNTSGRTGTARISRGSVVSWRESQVLKLECRMQNAEC